MSNTKTGFGDFTKLLDLNLEPGAVDNANRRADGPVAGDTKKRRQELYEYIINCINNIEEATTDTYKSKLRDELKGWFYASCDSREKKYLKNRFIEEKRIDLMKIFNPPLPDAAADAAADAVDRLKKSNGGSRKLKSKRKSSKSVRKFKKYNRRNIKSKKTRRVYK